LAGAGSSATARLRALALALLIPFLAFSLLTPGTMLAPDAMGRVMVILCGDSAPVEMTVAADGSLAPADHAPDHVADHPPCGWASHAQQFLGLPVPALPAASGLPRAFVPPPRFAIAMAPAAPLQPLARGPPRMS
jgi:hypothetical protein